MFSSEAPLHYSQVALVDPLDGFVATRSCRYCVRAHFWCFLFDGVFFIRRGTKIRYERLNGEKVRVSKRTDRVIPKPAFQRSDWKSRDAYIGLH